MSLREPSDLEPEERGTHRLLAAIPPQALPLGFRDSVMRRVITGPSVGWEWVVALVLAFPSLAFLAFQVATRGGEFAAALNNVIIAATNHPQMLDHALFRRFDDVLEFSPPVAGQAEQAMNAKLGAFASRGIEWKAAAKAAQGLSYAEITRACEDAVKDSGLPPSTLVAGEALRYIHARRWTR